MMMPNHQKGVKYMMDSSTLWNWHGNIFAAKRFSRLMDFTIPTWEIMNFLLFPFRLRTIVIIIIIIIGPHQYNCHNLSQPSKESNATALHRMSSLAIKCSKQYFGLSSLQGEMKQTIF